MKSILLTSTALVAFAGAAAAESHASADMMGPQGVVWGADGEFGYNEEVEGGFYFDGGLAISTTAGMNMGLTAGLTLDVDLGFVDATTNTPTGAIEDNNGDGAFENGRTRRTPFARPMATRAHAADGRGGSRCATAG